MATSAHQYATVPDEESRWHLSSNIAPTLSPAIPEHDLPHTGTPLSAAFEDLAETLFTGDDHLDRRQSLSNVLKSLTGSQLSTQSYELVEEDDYEHAQITPRVPKNLSEVMMEARLPSPKDDTPVRTASISRHLPLHNPTPDLQSLQGAYLKNVQALEDSAERISLASSMEDELQRIKADMRRSESIRSAGYRARQYSTTSNKSNLSHSMKGVHVATRSRAQSGSASITSPSGSLSHRRPAPRTTRLSKASNPLPEPELEGRPLESAMTVSPPAHAMQPRPSTESHRSISQHSLQDRPGTSASNDTYRQAQNLFTDFDGIHFSPVEDEFSRRISLARPPLARDSKVFTEPQPDQQMVYYPAPVPVMLNLPKRLSKGNWAQQEKRRTIALQSMPMENRKSAVWLADAADDAEFRVEPPAKRMSQLPPQLRASAFFDAPSQKTDIQLKHQSAVRTLDDILDAAAHAPVSAFTDHPIAGHLGNEVYGSERKERKISAEVKQKRRSSLSNMLNRRKSNGTMDASRRMSQALDNEVEMADDDPEKAAERSIAPDEDELEEDEKGDSEDEGREAKEEHDAEQHQFGFHTAPTTLLAELQMRKAQQKLRNRTAANAFPTGMHSTLLELDAVSQLQQKARKQKHVALAWEDRETVDKDNYDDDDVPLGVLFPEKEKQSNVNFHRPLGLMEKKELEENEPLSFRRARLRGEPYKPPQPQPSPLSEEPAPIIKLPDIDDNDEEGPDDETLAQRRKRMQSKQNKRVSLADDIASQLGLEPDQARESSSKTTEREEQEETLGQRRKRLQAESEQAASRPQLKQKTSMGDLLRANPVRPRNDERQSSAEVMRLAKEHDPNMPLVDHIQAAQPGTKALPAGNPPPYFPNQPLLAQHHQQQIMYANAMQSSPNLNMMNGFGMPPQPIYNSSMGMSNLNLSHGFGNVNNMMYNPMMNMNMAMGVPHMQVQMQMPMGMAAPAYDAIGMGPPLNSQQRASIDRWRQGIA